MSKAPCVCACDHERHEHFNSDKYCGWCGSYRCDRYRSIRTEIAWVVALTVVTPILPVSGGLLTYAVYASGLPLIALVVGLVSLWTFAVYRDRTVTHWRSMNRYRIRRRNANGARTQGRERNPR